jgi:hypothetical protein
MRSSANFGSFGFHRLCFWSRDKLTKRLKTRSIRSCIFMVFEDALVGNVVFVVPSCSPNHSYYLSRRERLPSTETHLSSACRIGLRVVARIVPSSYRLLSTTAQRYLHKTTCTATKAVVAEKISFREASDMETRECSFCITSIGIEDLILKCPSRWNRTQKKYDIGTNSRMDSQAQSLEAQACKPRFGWLLQPQVPLRELSYVLLVDFTIRQVKKAEARKESTVCNFPHHSHDSYRKSLKQIAVYQRKNSNPSTFVSSSY